MPLRLRWLPSHSASALHAALAIAREQTLVDAELAAVLTQPTNELRQEMASAGLPVARYWRMLCSLATTFDNNRQLAKMALYRTLGHASAQELSERLGGRISDLEAALLRYKPDIVDELSLRGRPLREQWEARGPGMLHEIFTATDARLEVDVADVVLVLPALGGGGEAQLHNNSVRMEAVLTNPHPQLPETVRLAWMLSQLHLDLPFITEGIAPERLPMLAALAMIPPALSAAQQVDLVKMNDDLVRFAIDAWRVPVPPTIDAVDVVMRWWDAYELSRPPLEVAFRALDEMVG